VEVTPNQFTIRQASREDVEPLYDILVKCGLDMRDRLGLAHWIPAYPRDLFEEHIEKGAVFSVEARGGEPVATFTASCDAPDYLDLSLWPNDAKPALYLSQLAVSPKLQGRGIGRACIAAAERLAIEHGCRSIRLDVAESHAGLLDWYLGLGYRESCRYEAFGTRMVGFEKLVSLRAA
jgi:ribosomal protein S18 acetylase RimI-like enzyme